MTATRWARHTKTVIKSKVVVNAFEAPPIPEEVFVPFPEPGVGICEIILIGFICAIIVLLLCGRFWAAVHHVL
jgi:hypothetical protein